MKRDMELVAKILAEIEKFPASGGHVYVEGYSDEAIEYHLSLLGMSGYVRYVSKRHVEGLTWKGHDLCEELNKTPLAETITAHATER
jgi:hypothetical protein